MKYEVGHRVQVKGSSIPCRITNVLMSKLSGTLRYEVTGDDGSVETFPASELEPYEEKAEYKLDVQYANDIYNPTVVVVFYKIVNGQTIEIARGHGHIMHSGEIGIAQAISYAVKRIYEKIGGTF